MKFPAKSQSLTIEKLLKRRGIRRIDAKGVLEILRSKQMKSSRQPQAWIKGIGGGVNQNLKSQQLSISSVPFNDTPRFIIRTKDLSTQFITGLGRQFRATLQAGLNQVFFTWRAHCLKREWV